MAAGAISGSTAISKCAGGHGPPYNNRKATANSDLTQRRQEAQGRKEKPFP